MVVGLGLKESCRDHGIALAGLFGTVSLINNQGVACLGDSGSAVSLFGQVPVAQLADFCASGRKSNPEAGRRSAVVITMDRHTSSLFPSQFGCRSEIPVCELVELEAAALERRAKLMWVNGKMLRIRCQGNSISEGLVF